MGACVHVCVHPCGVLHGMCVWSANVIFPTFAIWFYCYGTCIAMHRALSRCQMTNRAHTSQPTGDKTRWRRFHSIGMGSTSIPAVPRDSGSAPRPESSPTRTLVTMGSEAALRHASHQSPSVSITMYSASRISVIMYSLRQSDLKDPVYRVCVRACVRSFVRVRACVHVCVCVRASVYVCVCVCLSLSLAQSVINQHRT